MSGERAAEELALRNQVCFALYSASRAVTAVYRPILDRMGLTYPQYLVLLVLWQADPDGVTVKALGENLMLDSGTLSPLLKRMVAAGQVVKERSPDDERSVIVSLTPAGRRLRSAALGVPGQLADATGLAPAELRRLRQTLQDLARTLADA